MDTATIVTEMRKSIGDGAIGPGTAAAFNAANVPGDCIAQGDVEFTMIATIPSGLVRRKSGAASIVYGESSPTHTIEDPSAVEFYDRADWSADSLDGPCIRVLREVRVVHSGAGHHGPVTLTPACYEITYPRVWEVEDARERRARD